MEKPKTINTDNHFGYKGAIPMLKVTGELHRDVKHRKVKYLNNAIESDHGKLKRLTKPKVGIFAYPLVSSFRVYQVVSFLA